MADTASGSFEPELLATPEGSLFLLTYPARTTRTAASAKGGHAVVVLPAFAEEMNKCRRQTALTARALCARGITTFVPDFHGTGDSDGDFGQATLAHWREDFRHVLARVRSAGFETITWLATRGGALLAVDALTHGVDAPATLLLWQPVPAGKTMLTQFLRLKAAASLTQGGDGASARDLRAALAAGEAVEVAGYWLHPDLVRGLDELHLKNLPAHGNVHWFQVQNGDAPPPAARNVLQGWRDGGTHCAFHAVPGEPFWSTAEIALAPALTDATVEVLST